MGCIFCREHREQFWDDVDRWDRQHSRYWEFFDREPDGDALLDANKKSWAGCEEANRIYSKLIEQGSILALQHLAACYAYGRGVGKDANRAHELFASAIERGSASASLEYSQYLFTTGDKQQAVRILEDAVSDGVVAANFWLAWRMHALGTDRAGYERIELLLREANKAGHPAAAMYLSRFLVRGRMGLARIPEGLKGLIHFLRDRLNRSTGNRSSEVAK